jgi:hypothetical protein
VKPHSKRVEKIGLVNNITFDDYVPKTLFNLMGKEDGLNMLVFNTRFECVLLYLHSFRVCFANFDTRFECALCFHIFTLVSGVI